jgi:hypothetical protein
MSLKFKWAIKKGPESLEQIIRSMEEEASIKMVVYAPKEETEAFSDKERETAKPIEISVVFSKLEKKPIDGPKCWLFEGKIFGVPYSFPQIFLKGSFILGEGDVGFIYLKE